LTLLAGLAFLLTAGSALATFPGGNGKIAFTGLSRPEFPSERGVFVMNPDGTDQTFLTEGMEPAWSPDGQKIAFASDRDGNWEIYVMNADGSGITRLTYESADDLQPAWSPDGQKLVFLRFASYQLWTMNADGTDLQPLGETGYFESQPRWSPDGAWIAYTRQETDPLYAIWKIHPDGTGRTNLTPIPSQSIERSPDWSPEGLLLVYTGLQHSQGEGLWTMAPNGTGRRQLTVASYEDPKWSPDGEQWVLAYESPFTHNSEIATLGDNAVGPHALTSTGQNFEPDWQPVVPPPPPAPLYPHPRGATPMEVSLVPAFDECTSPSESHGPPLAFGSCNPPAQSSPYLTIGTPDANGQAAGSVGEVEYKVLAGDVRVTANITDVRCRTADVETCAGGELSDYTGELEATSSIRVTDRVNGRFASAPGTLDRFQFPFRIPCAETASTRGATCSVVTTFNTVLPGVVSEGGRANWELGQIQVRDGGLDGSANTDDYATFLVQGLFAP
jgi:Tol biopolymer transport system component